MSTSLPLPPDITRCSQYGGNATSERRAANNITKRPSPERSGLIVREAGVCFGRSADLTPCDQVQLGVSRKLVVALELRWAVNRQRRLDFNCGQTELQRGDFRCGSSTDLPVSKSDFRSTRQNRTYVLTATSVRRRAPRPPRFISRMLTGKAYICPSSSLVMVPGLHPMALRAW
jgi:hypothetical protein